MTASAESTHRAFRSLAEASRALSATAGFAELLAAAVAAGTLAAWTGLLEYWGAPAAVVLSGLASACRLRAQALRDVARRGRWIGLTAFAYGQEVPPAEYARVLSEVPSWGRFVARRVPGFSLESYFGAQPGGGIDGIRLGTACSAFFTSRLLKRSAQFRLALALTAAALAFGMVYYLASGTTARPEDAFRTTLLDFVCTVVVVTIAFGMLRRSLELGMAARTADHILQDLIGGPAPPSLVQDAAFRYEVNAARSSDPPLWLYILLRRRLNKEWAGLAELVRRTEAGPDWQA